MHAFYFLFVGIATAEYAKTLGGKVGISSIGIGTWAWGDRFYWNYDSSQDAGLKETFDYCVKDGGINFFDTAEIYGFGRSELLGGRFRRQLPSEIQQNVVFATKFAPLPFRFGKDCVVSACQDSLDRLGLDKLGLYQLHWPGLIQNDAYLEGLASCYQKGLVDSVGVSNYGPEQLRRAHKFLSDRGVPLATNQVQFSLLCRHAETNGLLRTAEELGVTILAYSPLAQGLLTGKFESGQLPRGPRSALARATLPKIRDGLLPALKEIATAKSAALNLNVTVSQVALNWCISKGVVPIPGARSLAQAKDNCDTTKWSLEKEEVTLLDEKAKASGVNILSPLEGR